MRPKITIEMLDVGFLITLEVFSPKLMARQTLDECLRDVLLFFEGRHRHGRGELYGEVTINRIPFEDFEP